MPRPAAPPITQKREFWVLMGYAAALGVFGGFAGLVSLRVIKFGGKWVTYSRPGWFDGHWWWVAVTAGAGVVVGVLRRVTRLPEEVPGLFDDLKAERVNPGVVPGTVAVSAVSLIGGASVGPEKVLASMGGGVGSWLAQRRGLNKENSQVSTLAGIAGMFGGVISSPVIVVMLILEVVRAGGHRFSKILATDIVAGSVSFGIYFAVVGAVFLGAYQVPGYNFEDWQLLAGIPLGLFGALVTSLTAGFMVLASRLFGLLKVPGRREIDAGRRECRAPSTLRGSPGAPLGLGTPWKSGYHRLMVSSAVYNPGQWNNFFVLVGTGSAALTGLVFRLVGSLMLSASFVSLVEVRVI
jgi:H+/Cl- antiporter ClcA